VHDPRVVLAEEGFGGSPAPAILKDESFGVSGDDHPKPTVMAILSAEGGFLNLPFLKEGDSHGSRRRFLLRRPPNGMAPQAATGVPSAVPLARIS
jgi:hypothetical protein